MLPMDEWESGYKNNFMISYFRLEVDENSALLGCYTASSCNSLPTFRGNLSVPASRERFLTVEDGTDRLFGNIGEDLQLRAA